MSVRGAVQGSDGRMYMIIRPKDSPPFARGILAAWSARTGEDVRDRIKWPAFRIPLEDYRAIETNVRAELGVKGTANG